MGGRLYLTSCAVCCRLFGQSSAPTHSESPKSFALPLLTGRRLGFAEFLLSEVFRYPRENHANLHYIHHSKLYSITVYLSAPGSRRFITLRKSIQNKLKFVVSHFENQRGSRNLQNTGRKKLDMVHQLSKIILLNHFFLPAMTLLATKLVIFFK